MLPDFRVRQRDYLLEINRAITEELDLEEVLNRIVRVSAELLGASAGLIALRDESGGWRIAATYGINPSFIQYLDPLLADIPDHGDPARFELPEVNRRLQRITKAASMGLLNGVGLPMVAQGEVIGVIFVFRAYQGHFSAEDRNLLGNFAAQAAIAAQNAKLFTEVNQQKLYLDAVLESSADGLFLLDSAYRFTRFNRACSRMTGYEPEEVIGRYHNEIIRWLRKEPGLSLEEAVAGGWPLSPQATLYVEGDLIIADGSALSVGITYAPTLSSEGKLLSIIANLRDITKFREAEELKSAFISIISHELRTPVALIKGYTGTLRREDAEWDPEVVRTSLSVIEEEADRLAGLIDDLLDASRLQAGALSLNQTDLALDSLIQRITEKYARQAPEHEFQFDFPKDFPIVYGDEGRLTQVITNLVSNAVKYSPDGGQITISGRTQMNEVVICIEDEGIGISSEDIPRIFDQFYRSNDAARKTKGAGLGLYLAKAVVEAHGGRIWVDDQTSKGTRICFSLPLDHQKKEEE